MKQFLYLLLVSTTSFAQSAKFIQEYRHGFEQNPSGLKLTIETSGQRVGYCLSDVIRVQFTFASQKTHVYTIETEVGGNAATTTANFIIDGPGLTSPIHTEPIDRRGYVCCGSRRHYLGRSPVSLSDRGIELIHLAFFGNGMTIPPLQRYELNPGDYVLFAQTRNVMRGWPKTAHDAYHGLSNIVLTSSNILHFKVVACTP